MALENDESLVAEFVRTGSKDAFAELYYRYKDKVFNTAYRITGEYEGARDVVHDVFLKVYGDVAGFRFKSSFSSWLYRIAVNRSLDETRKVKRRRTHSSADAAGEVASARADDCPEKRALDRETEAAIAKAVAALPPKLRIAVTLRYFEGLGYEQIAEVLGRPAGTVKSRLRRAHRKLGDLLGDMRLAPVEGEHGLLDCTDPDA